MSSPLVPRPFTHMRNIILYIGSLKGDAGEIVHAYGQKGGRPLSVAVLCDSNEDNLREEEKADILISVDSHSPTAIQTALLPYQERLLAVTCRGENNIPLFTRVIPHLPYLKTPTVPSLKWSSDKLLMRKRLVAHDKTIAPKYMVIHDERPETLEKIEKTIGFPLMVKPTGLAASRLVTLCYHKEELAQVIAAALRRMKQLYKETGGTWEPKLLVEQFMEGEMYSVDCYVNDRGRVWFCPMVSVTTGQKIGFDDFFGYLQMTPTTLTKENIDEAETAALNAIHALALKSTTAHIELMKTEEGWKIIEIGARIGGFRHRMYELTRGINHALNDVLIRIPRNPVIPKKQRGYAAAMKFFAKKEGRLTSLTGIKKAGRLASCQELFVHKKIGDRCRFAKHGGSSVFNIILFNTDRSKLLADIRRLEQMIKIETA